MTVPFLPLSTRLKRDGVLFVQGIAVMIANAAVVINISGMERPGGFSSARRRFTTILPAAAVVITLLLLRHAMP